ncbi:dityrosine transporter A Q resistance [Yamadazyma tenuis ATCC 10573]|uniref:Dityrosine transporter A Q resistance n=1 Tax=Candida tenuis (strain ATCC 10573 / BCRC 21748 / CBS 615 / JCM 9827 / NBRC 10315 / NRRL Y-1498 / VKM Y-70) TaxID=590646 RepID=G3AW33_CANTC|nr:dityrosine transporter A Q resistance [Yamadazyma tenuis ATCC 10573]EGV66437.1 dityrosine transporter A Q resistance [Yamadazyma tenuis ATCC 10573]
MAVKDLPSEKNSSVKEETFTNTRRNIILAVVTCAGFLGPLAGNIYIPILPLMSEAFNVSTSIINGTVSVFMAVFAFSPLVWAALADVGGRKSLYMFSLLIFLVANILLTFLPAHIGALYTLRVIQAIGSSSVLSVGAGTVADITPPTIRGKTIATFMLGPQLGPIIGPILSLATTNGQWRWSFGILSIFTIVVYIAILFLLPETLRYLVGRGECYEGKSYFVKPKLYEKKRTAEDAKYPKPPKLSPLLYFKLARYLPVLISSVAGGLLFASFYGISVTFSRVLTNDYHFSNLHVCLSYLCPGIALIIGSMISGRLSDKLRRNRIAKGISFIPEDRFPIQLIGFLVAIAGFTGYGWTCEKHSHVVSIFVTVFISCFGTTWVLVTNLTYLTESAEGIPASNVAFGNFMRNAGAAICSGIITKLVERMGYGWCFTGLAFVNLGGATFMILLFSKGKHWREKYGYLTK